MLVLPIKKKWFDMIKSGEKKEEYREIKPYYETRFKNEAMLNMDGGFMVLGAVSNEIFPLDIIFKNGYRKDSPKLKCVCSLRKDYGKEEWGAEPKKLYYVLKIISLEEK